MIDLEKYKDYHIEYVEVDILPTQCNNCEDDCGSCDIALTRWTLSERDKLILKRKSRCMQIKQMLRELERIDAKLEVLENG